MGATMKRAILLAAFVLGIGSSCAHAEEPKKEKPKQISVRQKFVPGSKPMAGESEYEGASCTALSEGGPGGPGRLFMMAHSGVGDTFPVREEKGPDLFEVAVVEGDDEHLVLEVRTKDKDAAQKIQLKRDKLESVQVAEIKYDFLFPTVSVAAFENEKPTTPKAMIIVTRPK
jgi:hypothetical protein